MGRPGSFVHLRSQPSRPRGPAARVGAGRRSTRRCRWRTLLLTRSETDEFDRFGSLPFGMVVPSFPPSPLFGSASHPMPTIAKGIVLSDGARCAVSGAYCAVSWTEADLIGIVELCVRTE